MSKFKNTPGPWKFDFPDLDQPAFEFEYIIIRNNFGDLSKLRKSIAFINQDKKTGKRKTSENIANARLMAASPSMRDALIEYFIEEGGSDKAKLALEEATGLSIEEVLK